MSEAAPEVLEVPDPDYIDIGCEVEKCGLPQDGPGHPKRGWVRSKQGGDTRWFCSWYCLGKYAIRRALRGEA